MHAYAWCVCVCVCAISSYACLEERETMLKMQVEGKQLCVAINREWVVMSAMCRVAMYMAPQEMAGHLG